ncbi:MAG: hypothetical protein NC038_05390 [Paludibacter sp.]|nr:hypothetical protein [Bacteroidales bacterium]MCM1069804.1 hypothetical protein [Prevotella sp.]MCM1354002.1 hypothetical protein [Bacteroides sp.]MCM1443356.1 hypothetical protein [Muribaculum sp.]MCM1482059.1 hypothetical protein [Paludibacter sp.]
MSAEQRVQLSKTIIVLPADSASSVFPLAATGLSLRYSAQVTTHTGATATISSVGDTTFRLQVCTPLDTIVLRDTLAIPAYITKIAYKDKIIYQMSTIQSFFFVCGVAVFIFVLLGLLLHIILRSIHK